ncbi:MAG: hypothetical protein Q9179_002598 [Wetmoreana sp. 5 TL-2023]
MVTTWEFHSFRGRVPQRVCESLWSDLATVAWLRVHSHRGHLPVMQWPVWKREIKASAEGARPGDWFDMVFKPRWKLTWLMFLEAAYYDQDMEMDEDNGLPVVCFQQKEFYVDIFAEGKLVGNGWMQRRREAVASSNATDPAPVEG